MERVVGIKVGRVSEDCFIGGGVGWGGLFVVHHG